MLDDVVERITAAVTTTVERFGGLHYAVNNAGISSENHDLPELHPGVISTP